MTLDQQTKRSETISVRLDPQLRYLADLAARQHRRSLSSFIAWAIERSLTECILNEQTGKSLLDEAEQLWHTDPRERFVLLAKRYPNLLSFEQQVMWRQVCENSKRLERYEVKQ